VIDFPKFGSIHTTFCTAHPVQKSDSILSDFFHPAEFLNLAPTFNQVQLKKKKTFNQEGSVEHGPTTLASLSPLLKPPRIIQRSLGRRCIHPFSPPAPTRTRGELQRRRPHPRAPAWSSLLHGAARHRKLSGGAAAQDGCPGEGVRRRARAPADRDRAPQARAEPPLGHRPGPHPEGRGFSDLSTGFGVAGRGGGG
jgi:hypothetical protein